MSAQNQISKLFALFISLALLVSVIPLTAFAEDEETIHNAQFTMHNEGNGETETTGATEETGEETTTEATDAATEEATEATTEAASEDPTEPTTEAMAALATPTDIMPLAADGDYEYNNMGGIAIITKYNGSGGDIVIPDTLGGLPVESIDAQAFLGNDNLTGVVIPEGVTFIGLLAFYGCSDLTSVRFPKSLVTIEDSAFAGCSSLTGVLIPLYVSILGEKAFSNCTELDYIYFEGLSPPDIGTDAFENISPDVQILVTKGYEDRYNDALTGTGLQVNRPPNIKPNVQNNEEITITLGETYSVDLTDIFEDADGDDLSYVMPGNVFINSPNFTYSPDKPGVFTLRFHADDRVISEPYIVTLTVNAAPTYSITATPSVLDFGSLASPYVQPGIQLVTITNTGTGQVELNNFTGAANYTFPQMSSVFLDSGDQWDIAVQPKAGLPIGTYNEIITVTESNGTTASANLTFEVTAAQVTPPPPPPPVRPDPKPEPTRPAPRPSNDRDDDNDGDSAYSAPGLPAPTHTLRKGGGYYDTMLGRTVEVRLYADRPVSGYTSGADVTRVRGLFEKWFTNPVRAIHFDQSGQWEQPVKVAAKVDLAGMDTARLVIYYYDPKLGIYRRLAAPAYWIDANGYLHFQTEYAGEIVIAEGELEKK